MNAKTPTGTAAQSMIRSISIASIGTAPAYVRTAASDQRTWSWRGTAPAHGVPGPSLWSSYYLLAAPLDFRVLAPVREVAALRGAVRFAALREVLRTSWGTSPPSSSMASA